MSMFAALHQFPFGMLLFSLSVFCLTSGFNYEKNNVCIPQFRALEVTGFC
jgi:hypothetical protein